MLQTITVALVHHASSQLGLGSLGSTYIEHQGLAGEAVTAVVCCITVRCQQGTQLLQHY